VADCWNCMFDCRSQLWVISDAREECWHVGHRGVRAGTIAIRRGNPTDTASIGAGACRMISGQVVDCDAEYHSRRA
jgi:hypothetical protein